MEIGTSAMQTGRGAICNSADSRIVEHLDLAVRYVKYFVRRWRCRVPHEEVVSLANLAVCRASQGYVEARKAQFKTYLYLVVQDTLKQYLNKECRYAKTTGVVRAGQDGVDMIEKGRQEVGEGVEECYTSPHGRLEDKQRKSVLRSIVRQLSPAEGRVIEHLFFGDGEVRELSPMLGCSERQVWRKRNLALRNLRNILETACMDL